MCIHTGGAVLRGSEYALLEVLQGIASADPDRRVMLLCDRAVMRRAAAAAGLEAFQIPSGELMFDPPTVKFSGLRLLAANLKVLRWIKAFKADIVYCNGGRSCQSALPAARRAGVPLVVHLHAPYPKRYHIFYATPLASAVIHVSNYIKKYHESRVRLPKSFAVVNGIDFDALLKSRESKFSSMGCISDLPEDSVVLGFMGSLIHRKGLDILIESVSLLRNMNRPVFLLIGGKGDAKAYRRQVKRLELEKYVRFLGEITDRVGFFSCIDIHVLPSRSEAFGRTIAEAAFCGKPSVAHSVGGIPEAVPDTRFGKLYSPNDPETLAGAVCELIDKGSYKSAQAEISGLAKQHFQISRVVGQILDIFDQV
ncbi:MAG: glycosyltransferase family 4 protein [Desulfobacteraceae bacterium]|nr:glycosyltransferase family 4 protein [Desulfobacteraceae bacterium]